MSEKVFKSTNWWPTPILTIEQKSAEEMNAGLYKIILEKEREIVSKATKSIKVAGLDEGLSTLWLEYNVLNWNYPEGAALRALVVEGFAEFMKQLGMQDDPGVEVMGISCWANILRPGQALTFHHHDPAFASAHYTVTTGYEEGVLANSPEAGHTIYYRPGFADRSHGGKANGIASPWDDDWRIARQPKPGNMIFFPSYVRHEVRPNFGTKERVSLAMDIFVKKQELPMYFGGPRWFTPNAT
jgi:uncharacterized protein (TIGR02466 family)